MDIPLDDRPTHELESIIVAHGDQIQPAASNPPPPRAAGPSGSLARTLLSQPSKIMAGVQGFASRVGGDKRHPGRTTAASGAKGLRFLDKKAGGWKAVEKRFDQFAVDGRLPKESFGRCIGESLLLVCRYTFFSLVTWSGFPLPRHGRVAGVRWRAICCFGKEGEHNARTWHHQRRTEGVLAANDRPKLRLSAADLLRHVLNHSLTINCFQQH